MSRTWKDAPRHVRQRKKQRFLSPKFFEIWDSLSAHFLANRRERSARRRARTDLHMGREPEPYRPRRSAKCDLL